MRRSLNLLHYPSLARQQKIFHRCWSSLAGLCVGGAMAWLGLQWLDQQTPGLRQEQARLQADALRRTRGDAEAARSLGQSREQAGQGVQLEKIVQHQQAWVSLHDALQTEAGRSGLRLERLQAGAEKLLLQGTLPYAQAMPQARQNVSEPLAQGLEVTRLSVGANGESGFVWQAPWPSAQPSAAPTSKQPAGTKP